MKSRTSLLALCAGMMASGAVAQDFGDEDYIGTVTIGESRRGVQTDEAASRTVINQDEIDSRQATTLGQLMDSIPNVSLINGTLPQGSGVTIRGLGAQAGTYGTDGKVNVVVDGVQSGAEEIYRNGSFLSLEPELFKELDVTRGPADGFRYSAGAIGGTIEATTKDATDFVQEGDSFAFRQKLGYEGNGNGILSTSILAFAPDDKFDAILFYGRRSADDREDGDGNVLTGTEFEQTGVLAKLNYRFNDASKLTFGFVKSDIPERDVFYSAYDPNFSSEKVDRDTQDTTGYLEFSYDPLDNDAINLTARLQFKEEVIDITSLTGATGIYDAGHTTTTTSLRVTNEALFATGAVDHSLLTGIEIGRRERTSYAAGTTVNDISAPGGIDEYVALFLTDEMEIGDRLTLTPQMRYETQTLTSQNNAAGTQFGRPVAAIPDGTSHDKSSFTGAISARYAFNDSFAVFGTAAYNENMPILDDLRSVTNIGTSEKAQSYELGLSYDNIDVFTDGDTLKTKVTAYKTHIWDVTSYFRVNDVDLHGAEVELSYANPNFYVDFNAARSRGKQNGGSAFFDRATGDTAQLTVGKRFLNDQLDISLEAKHAWANDRTTAVASARNPNPPLAASDAHTLYTLAGSYEADSGTLKGVQFNASIENLTNETYRAYGNSRNGLGRTFKFSVTKTF